MRRKILALTGIRSEYDIFYSVFSAIQNHVELELGVVVVGAHLSNSYGHTVDEIRADGFSIEEEIESLINSNTVGARVKGLGVQIQCLVQTVSRVRPDILLVLGDREESIALALVGAYMNIPVAHIAGGDRAIGNVDDQVRHAVTKLSHIHLATNEQSKERILRLGEQKFRVFNVGNPGLDRLLSVPKLNKSELSKRIDFNLSTDSPFLVVIQHVISTEVECAYDQMRETLEAIELLEMPTIIIQPNSDAGSEDILRAIHAYRELPNLKIAKNIPRLEFVNILRMASCLLGNSSAGILEAPLLKLPVVNIGNRQKGRLHSENVIFVPHDRFEIVKAVQKSLFSKIYKQSVACCSNPYGEGDSGPKIANILASIKIDDDLLIKDITF
jgi:GDP/UDP-N,N'-diacetylbacillosamine 2-epimerase (hydrolysing)